MIMLKTSHNLSLIVCMICFVKINANSYEINTTITENNDQLNCTAFDERTYAETPPDHMCPYGQWLAEYKANDNVYLCCTSQTSAQRLRDQSFRIAMTLGHVMPATGCLLYTLCDYGCRDLLNYGVQATNPTTVSDDPNYFKTMVKAWQTGQVLASGGAATNVSDCGIVCTDRYRECSTGTTSVVSNVWNKLWLNVYHYGHVTGMGTFHTIQDNWLTTKWSNNWI